MEAEKRVWWPTQAPAFMRLRRRKKSLNKPTRGCTVSAYFHRPFAALMWAPENLHVFLGVECVKEHDVVAFVGT
jgi:hypothetical protein